MERLLSLFNEIRTCFFPRWDTKKQWRCEAALEWHETLIDGGSHGFCDDKNKIIRIWPAWGCQDDNTLRVLLIHEIAHAVTREAHYLHWQSRCLKAANKAEGMGDQHLAEGIHLDVKRYQDSTPLDEIKDLHRIRKEETKAALKQLQQVADISLNELGRMQLSQFLRD
jgi:hypothetical protein